MKLKIRKTVLAEVVIESEVLVDDSLFKSKLEVGDSLEQAMVKIDPKDMIEIKQDVEVQKILETQDTLASFV